MALGRKKILVEQATGTSYVGGVAQKGEQAPVEIYGSIQPLTDREYTMLDLGRSSSSSFKVYTNSPLKNGDVLTLPNTSRYEVIKGTDFVSGLMPHVRAIVKEYTDA